MWDDFDDGEDDGESDLAIEINGRPFLFSDYSDGPSLFGGIVLKMLPTDESGNVGTETPIEVFRDREALALHLKTWRNDFRAGYRHFHVRPELVLPAIVGPSTDNGQRTTNPAGRPHARTQQTA